MNYIDEEMKKPSEILEDQLRLLSDICRSDTCSPGEIAQLTEQMVNLFDTLQGCDVL